MPRHTRFRFDGHIAGAGTASGTRLVLGHWVRSPRGCFSDVMVQRDDGHRILLAPDEWVAAFVSSTYTFDEVVRVPVHVRTPDLGGGTRWTVSAGPLNWTFAVGQRAALGHLLRALPPPLARLRTAARVSDVVARRMFPGVRTLGSAGHDRTEWYAARDLHRLATSYATWSGTDLGPLTDVDPPADFGFSSTPRTPTLTTLTSIVRVCDDQPSHFAAHRG